jgi:glycosyltransferase involved in cell wall biosynthesis
MRSEIGKDNLDIVHFPSSYGFGPIACPTVITLQDEINVLPLTKILQGHRKNIRTMTTMSYLHFVTLAALPRAQKVITVSEYSKGQIIRYSGLSPNKLAVVPHACPQDIQRVEEPDVIADVRHRLSIRRPFVLAEAFKNPGVLVRAWRLLPKNLQENHEIIFFSRSETVLPVVHEAIEAGLARLFVRPARRDLSTLYSLAQAFVFPSWIEGFGIPLLEAMTCGAPIIASDRGSIPEVAGDAAFMMDAEDERRLADYLCLLFEDPSARQTLQERGFRRVQHFSWSRIIKQVLDVYQEAKSSENAGVVAGSAIL